MSTEVRVPTLGESVTEATVATWFKKPGDAVAVDEMLCELETDKVTVEVPSPAAGTLGEIVAAEGDTVGVDALLATIAEGAAARSRRQARRAAAKRTPPRPQPAKASRAKPRRGRRQRRRHGADPGRKRDRGDRVAPGSRRSATPSRRTKCCASWKPTRSASRCPRPPRAP